MSDYEIGRHDPQLVTCAPRLGWFECECGWIGPDNFTEERALESHDAHVARVTATEDAVTARAAIS